MRRSGLMQRPIRPERVMCAGFLALILAGGGLLALPVCAASGESVGLGAGLFTATSAVCVTGLIVVDTGTAFSLAGQLVLLTLIQLGGLGFMVFATLVMAAAGRRVTLRSRVLLRESLNAATLSGLVRLTRWYALATLVIEGAGAAALSVRFVPAMGWGRGLYFALWHAVSAFCNAGFDLFGGFSSLTAFQRDPVVLLTIAALIILGGTGFSVIAEVLGCRLRWRRLTLHARLSLVMTGLLLGVGTAFVALTEWRNPATIGGVGGAGHRLLNAFFHSATLRTAGFSAIDPAAMTDGTKLMSILLMLVGANSASTGGGMKTTTVAVLALAVFSLLRGRRDATVMGRRLPAALVLRATAVITVTLAAFLSGTLALTLLEGGRVPFIDLLFEAASALGTVGVSTAGTPELACGSRAVLALMMYLGRVGPLTLATALMNGAEPPSRVRCPEESVMIG